MASAKMFLGNKADGNDTVAATIKSGTATLITDIEQKEVGGKSEPGLACKVKGHELWIRFNKPMLKLWIAKHGDETDKWVGKKCQITHVPIMMMGKPATQVDVRPL